MQEILWKVLFLLLCDLHVYIKFSFFQPFVEKGHAIQRLFPPRMYAVIIPVVAGVVLLGIIGNCLLLLILKEGWNYQK